MLERVDCRSFSSEEILSTVALAAVTYSTSMSSSPKQRHDDTHSTTLEGVNSRGELGDVVGDGLEFAQNLLGLLDGSLVLQDGLVSSQVDFRDGGLERSVLGSGSGVSGSEGTELGEGFCGAESVTDDEACG
jgi:hypothetical protein